MIIAVATHDHSCCNPTQPPLLTLVQRKVLDEQAAMLFKEVELKATAAKEREIKYQQMLRKDATWPRAKVDSQEDDVRELEFDMSKQLQKKSEKESSEKHTRHETYKHSPS